MRSGRSLIRKSHGFTLVELLVVISIISLLVGMLLPALGSARSATHTVVCMANQKGIGTAWLNFASDHQDNIPAPGSIGQDLMTNSSGTGSSIDSLDIGGSATQPFDWAGALAFDYIGINRPFKRDERFALLNGASNEGVRSGGAAGVFACPANHNISVPFDDSPQPNGIDGTQFQPQLSMSYAAAREFMWWGQGGGRPRWAAQSPNYWGGEEPGTMSMPNWAQQWLPGGSQSTNSSYRPKLSRIGSVLSKKFILADGARFIDTVNAVIDHDVTASAGYGGAFADTGAWASDPTSIFASKAWPSGTFGGTSQDATHISFKHASRDGQTARGNVLKYDGSVETMEAGPTSEFRRPDSWFPTGSSLSFNSIPEALRDEYEDRAEGVHAFVSRVTLY